MIKLREQRFYLNVMTATVVVIFAVCAGVVVHRLMDMVEMCGVLN